MDAPKSRFANSTERANARRDDERKRHRRADRIARQCEYEKWRTRRSRNRREHRRLPRFHRQTSKVNLPTETFDRLFHEISVTHRGAARGDERVARSVGDGHFERCPRRSLVVSHYIARYYFCALFTAQRFQHRTVCVHDASANGDVARTRRQLIARAQNANARRLVRLNDIPSVL